MGRMGKPEEKIAKKKLPVTENFRSKEVLYLNRSVFVYCTVTTLGDPQIFSESLLHTTVGIRSVLRNNGRGHSLRPGKKGSGVVISTIAPTPPPLNDVPVLVPATRECVMWQRSKVTNQQIGRFSWIIQVGPIGSQRSLKGEEKDRRGSSSDAM